MKIIFAGTGPVALRLIKSIVDKIKYKECNYNLCKNDKKLKQCKLCNFSIIYVLTKAEDTCSKKSRNQFSFIKEIQSLNIKILIFNVFTDKYLRFIKKLNPDLCIVVSYGLIIPKYALKIPKLGWINVHFSLLPSLRGPAPIQHAILKNYNYTGVTIFKIDENIDSGPIIVQAKEKILFEDTSEDLLKRLTNKSCKLLFNVLKNICHEKINMNDLQSQYGNISFAPKIYFLNGKIDWHMDSLKILKHIKAMTPIPGAWSYLNKKIVKIRISKNPYFPSINIRLNPGCVIIVKKIVYIGTQDKPLTISYFQSQGRKIIPAYQWSIGNLKNKFPYFS